MDFKEGPVRDAVGNATIGERVQIYERVRKQINKRADSGHDLRITLGDKIVEVTPNYANDNINPGTATGAIVAVMTNIAETYIPVGTVLGDTEITSVEETSDGAIYDVNVDAILENEGRLKAFLESGQGIQSLVAEDFELIEEPKPFNKKPVQTTWQYRVKVKNQ
jgi:hypothetical protein